MKTILCFGDSNTHGSNPLGGRHPRGIRWPGRLQSLLGEGYYVIEEGMGGRTTVWDDPLEPGRNGIKALPIALHSHKPLDMVVLSLGTNDCKSHFHASPRIIARGMENLCDVVERYDYGEGVKAPRILLVSPVHIQDGIGKGPFASFEEEAAPKSRQLAPLYQKIAALRGHLYLDASLHASPSPADCLHMEAESHRALADALCHLILRELPTDI